MSHPGASAPPGRVPPAPRCRWAPLARFALALPARLPQPALLAFGRALAWPARLLRRRWQVARVNIALCFPEWPLAERSALLAAHRQSLCVAVLELLRAWFAPSAALRGLFDVEGLEHLRDAEASGEGVLLLTGHLMHTELATRFIAEALGRPVGGVVRRYDRHPCFEALLDGARRARLGPTVSKFDTRGMVRHLRAGGRLAYSADQDFRSGQVFVPFFGVLAATFAGVPQLLRAGRARLLFLSMVRAPDGRYRVRIAPTGLADCLDDAEGFTAGYMALLEQAVREAPDQYLWVHRRFKTRPENDAGSAPLYDS